MFRQQRRSLTSPYRTKSKWNASFSFANHKCSFRRRYLVFMPAAIFVLMVAPHYYNVLRRVYRRATEKPIEFTCAMRVGDNQTQSATAAATKSFARVILFQQDGGHQLQNFMTYYSKVFPLKDIVIIDHQTSTSKLNMNASETQGLLKQYNELGSDVWDCEGDFRGKADMWSYVANQYTLQTDYIFPLDVDELIAILKNNGDENESLAWNKEDFKETLDKLKKNTGKPFKLEVGRIQALDCPDQPPDQNEDAVEKINESLLTYHESSLQQAQYFLRRESRHTGCLDKCFFRGHEFKHTDTGNHASATHTWAGSDQDKLCEKNGGLAEEETLSGLVLMHAQFINFDEWFLHKLRGASDRGFNKYTNLINCNRIRTSIHYCQGWDEIHRTNFDPRKLKELYYKNGCSLRDRDLGNLYRIDVRHLFK